MAIGRTAVVDDSGAGTDGTVASNAWLTSLYDQIDGRWSEASTTSVGSQNDVAYAEADDLRANNATALTLTGLLAPAAPLKAGKRLIIYSLGAGTVALTNQDAGSVAANRIITGTGATLTLAAGTGWALLVYDGTTARWRVLGSSAAVAGGAVVQTITLTGAQADVALTAGVTELRCNNASLLTLSGFAAGTDGQRVDVVSVGAGQVDLAHQNVGSVAANRLLNYATSGNTSLAAGSGTATYEYDITTARWRLIGHEQGAWITPAYAAGNFTGTGSMTWTVDAGDVAVFSYRLSGRKLDVLLNLQTTSVGGTPSSQLQAAIPGGFTAAVAITNLPYTRNDNGVGNGFAIYQVSLNGALIRFFTDFGGSNWTAATNTTYIYAFLSIPVN
jgi:hypothetical protein